MGDAGIRCETIAALYYLFSLKVITFACQEFVKSSFEQHFESYSLLRLKMWHVKKKTFFQVYTHP